MPTPADGPRHHPAPETEHQDRFEIHQQVLRYCHSVDRRDWAGVRSVYAPDGWDHHTGFDGHADDYVAWLQKSLPHLDGSQHLVANHWCHLFGDAAVSETYGQAVHWGTPRDAARLNFTSGFRYVDHWVRTTDGWKVQERWAVREWQRDDSGRISGTTSHHVDPQRPQADDPFAVLLTRFTSGSRPDQQR